MEEFNLNKNKWKAEVLQFLYPEVRGIIDDNKLLKDQLELLHYEGKLFLYGPGNKGVRGDLHTVICPDWMSVEKEIAKI